MLTCSGSAGHIILSKKEYAKSARKDYHTTRHVQQVARLQYDIQDWRRQLIGREVEAGESRQHATLGHWRVQTPALLA